MTEYIVIFFSACLVNNLILDYLIGISPAVAVSRRVESAMGLSLAMIFTLTIASFVSYPIKTLLLIPLGMEYLQLISFVLVITLSILIGEKCIEKIKPLIHKKITVFIPLTLVNCSALGIALLNVQQTHGFFGSLIFGVGTSTGFGLIVVMLAAMRERIDVADVPKPFQGASILLITLGIISMAFMGFNGMGSH